MVPYKDTAGSPFIELQSVDSTNNYATALIHEGMAHHGTCVFAHEQNKGKGQRNKQWITQKSANIILSVVLDPQSLSIQHFFPFSVAMAIGAYNFFNNYVNDKVSIKWPNDIMWCARKAGGILIENILQGQQWKHAVVGVGININQTHFGDLESKAVSLKQITGKDYDAVSMSKELSAYLLASFNELVVDPNLVMEKYHHHLFGLNELIRFKKDSRVFKATVKGVTKEGQLKVAHTIEELFEVGSVEWVL